MKGARLKVGRLGHQDLANAVLTGRNKTFPRWGGRAARIPGRGRGAIQNDTRPIANTPRVANQKLDYLIKTLSDFRDNKRPNMPSMTALVRNFSADDIAAMAHYLAGL